MVHYKGRKYLGLFKKMNGTLKRPNKIGFILKNEWYIEKAEHNWIYLKNKWYIEKAEHIWVYLKK
jgi:hypothetical protein